MYRQDSCSERSLPHVMVIMGQNRPKEIADISRD
jgi:hypothetical protein